MSATTLLKTEYEYEYILYEIIVTQYSDNNIF